MSLDYGGYLDHLINTMAFTNWQYLFCEMDWNSTEVTPIYDRIKKSLADLSILFP